MARRDRIGVDEEKENRRGGQERSKGQWGFWYGFLGLACVYFWTPLVIVLGISCANLEYLFGIAIYRSFEVRFIGSAFLDPRKFIRDTYT